MCMYVHTYASADGEKVCIHVRRQVDVETNTWLFSNDLCVTLGSIGIVITQAIGSHTNPSKYPPIIFLTFTPRICGVGSNQTHLYAFQSSHVFCATCDARSPTTSESQKIGASTKRLWREAQSQSRGRGHENSTEMTCFLVLKITYEMVI